MVTPASSPRATSRTRVLPASHGKARPVKKNEVSAGERVEGRACLPRNCR